MAPCLTERGRFGPSLMLRFCRTIRAAEPDVVQTWRCHADLIGGAMARFAGVPVSWGVRQAELHPQKSPRATRAVARVCAWFSHAVPAKIVCCGDRVAQVHAELGYAPHRLEVVYNGFNVDVFKFRASTRHQVRRAWGVCEETMVIGCVARFDPQKDHANLLQAARLLADRGWSFRVALVGYGMTQTNRSIVQQISDLGLEDTAMLLGPQSDIPAIMSALDIHVLSSAYGEGFPNAVAEAMASSTPNVVTAVGDSAMVVGDTGWVVPPSNSAALAEAIERAMEARRDPRRWETLRSAARARIVEKFDLAAMVEGYRRVWRLVVDAKGQ
jgi:glycosyltransferase involved in cell wall biosynthesis